MLLRFDARARRLLQRLPHRYVYTGAELALLMFLAFQLARLVWAVTTPITPFGDWTRPGTPTEAFVEAPILREFDPFFRTTLEGGPVSVTSLDLDLLGTRVDTVSGRGSAIIESSGVQASYTVGEEVMPGVMLAGVDFDNVTIAHGGAREKIFLDQSTPAPAAAQ